MRDYVKCTKCDYVGLVEHESEVCPRCNKVGELTWATARPEVIPRGEFPQGVKAVCLDCGAAHGGSPDGLCSMCAEELDMQELAKSGKRTASGELVHVSSAYPEGA